MATLIHRAPPSRRGFLRAGLLGLGALLAGRRLARASAPLPRARACIVLWMNGGPSHLDTWDPKPGRPEGGPTRAIDTRLPSLQIADSLPRLADVADRLCVLRSLTSKEGNHERAQSLLHTGWSPNPSVAFPSLGAYVAEARARPSDTLPPFVSIGGPSRGPGFLGVEHGPFVVPRAGQLPANLAYPRDVDMVRFLRRKTLVDRLEADFAARSGDRRVDERRAVRDRAVRFMHSTRLAAFELEREPEAVRARYGDTDFGRGCLLARRLVESGVLFVEVTLDGWDTHQDNFGKVRTLAQTLDPAMATLIAELDERRLLDSTLVVWLGEFGRTPAINARDGRDHHPAAFSAVLAGGGARRGHVHGATTADGARVASDPVRIGDLFATLATLLGLDPDAERVTPAGRPIQLTDRGTPIRSLISV